MVVYMFAKVTRCLAIKFQPPGLLLVGFWGTNFTPLEDTLSTIKLQMISSYKTPQILPQKRTVLGIELFLNLSKPLDLFEKHGWERIVSYFQTRMCGVVKKPGV